MLDHRLETFLVLCEVMNYREAANRLNITQPAVTQQIKFLEREYGCPLFTYKNRQLKKTPAADILEKYAQSMRCHDQAIRKKIGQTNIRELRLGATKTIGDYFLRKQVFRFASNCENQLTFIVDNTEHLLKLLDENQLDYAVIEGFFDKNRYDHLLVRREPFVGICPKGHPFAGKQVSISQLLSETIIHREEGSGTRAILEQKLLGHNESLSRFRHSICISSFKSCPGVPGALFSGSFFDRIFPGPGQRARSESGFYSGLRFNPIRSGSIIRCRVFSGDFGLGLSA